jgi:hypothetical protein
MRAGTNPRDETSGIASRFSGGGIVNVWDRKANRTPLGVAAEKGNMAVHAQPTGFIQLSEPLDDSLPRTAGRAIRLNQRPVCMSLTVLCPKLLSDKHDGACYRHFQARQEDWSSLHHISDGFQTTYENSPPKTRPKFFALGDFLSSWGAWASKEIHSRPHGRRSSNHRCANGRNRQHDGYTVFNLNNR